MGSPDNYDACAIVSTNALREALNKEKATASCSESGSICCYALDKCPNRQLTLQQCQQLINLDTNTIGSSKSLPGSILFYIGMPVILCIRNLSANLGICNRSQGIVRHIFTAECPLKFKYATCVIVEFPLSNVQLPHLLPKHFLITPITWIFTTILQEVDKSQHKL